MGKAHSSSGYTLNGAGMAVVFVPDQSDPVDCEVGGFGPFSPCSRSCGAGFMTRVRALVHRTKGG
jgi:hypothetical protein